MLVLGNLIIIISFSLLFIFSGLLVYRHSFSSIDKMPFSFKFSASYFIGMGLFLAIWRLLSSAFSNVGVALILTLAILIVLYVKDGKFKTDLLEIIVHFTEKRYFALCAVIIVPTVILLYWLMPSGVITAFSILGSLHSPRYANIATFITENNYIPILSQNYGQSLLTSLPMLLGVNIPLFSLYLWLSISIGMISLFVYGLLKTFNLSKQITLIGTCLVLFGNTALSFTHILVIDSSTPFF